MRDVSTELGCFMMDGAYFLSLDQRFTIDVYNDRTKMIWCVLYMLARVTNTVYILLPSHKDAQLSIALLKYLLPTYNQYIEIFSCNR